jgi:uncharacterized protein YegL
MTGVKLILSKTYIRRSDPAIWRPTLANVAVVYADINGNLVHPDKLPRMRDSIRSPFRIRYEVDVGDHQRRFSAQTTPLPAKGDVYAFENEVTVGFRVTDPVAVVRRNVVDALPVVYPRLIDMMRQVTREFDIHDSASAERRVNALFAEPVVLDEGITVFLCRAQLSPDRSARQYVMEVDEASRSVELNRQLHVGAKDAAQHELELVGMRHRADLDRRANELAALGNDSLDYRRVLQLHLVQHPEDTERVLNLLVSYEQTQDDKRLELFQFMIEKNLVNPVDVDVFRRELLGGLHQQEARSYQVLPQSKTWIDEPSPTPAEPVTGSDGEIGPATAAELRGKVDAAAAASAPVQPRAARAATVSAEMPVREVPPPPMSAPSRDSESWTTATWDPVGSGLLPVYIVVEESAAVDRWLTELDDGVAALCRAFADTPTVAARVRLSVLGLAGDASPYLSNVDLRRLPPRPRFSVRGEPKYDAAFTELLGRVSGDMVALEGSDNKVDRPTVFFLTAGRPVDGDAWRTTHWRLVHLDGRRAPNIVVYGIAGAPPRTVEALASRADLAFVSDPNTEAGLAIRRFFDAVVRTVVQWCGAPASDRAELVVARPVGYQLVSEVT